MAQNIHANSEQVRLGSRGFSTEPWSPSPCNMVLV